MEKESRKQAESIDSTNEKLLSDVSQRSELLLDFMQHLSWYYNIDEVIDCSKHQHIIEQYIKSNNCG